jgi:hypothetical protein
MAVGLAVGLVIVFLAIFAETIAGAVREARSGLSSGTALPRAPALVPQIVRVLRSPIALLSAVARELRRALARPASSPSEETEIPVEEPADDGPRYDPGSGAVPAERGGIGSQRQYVPASVLHIDEQMRDFFRARGGSAPLDLAVRHFDTTFGAGHGRTLIERLRHRGLVRLVRDPHTPTRILVTLVGSPADAPDPR